MAKYARSTPHSPSTLYIHTITWVEAVISLSQRDYIFQVTGNSNYPTLSSLVLAHQVSMATSRKFFTELPKLKVLSRPEDNKSEVTVYVKGMSYNTGAVSFHFLTL